MSSRDGKAKGEQADGPSSRHHSWLKRMKNRLERRRAKRNPEAPPGYKKHRGWEL